MAYRYGKWLTRHVRPMTGQRVVITGGNSGIGYAAAEAFLSLGAAVTIACRNPKRASEACARLQARCTDAAIDWIKLDLASHTSIDACAAALTAERRPIDVFIHCAGVYYPREQRTQDDIPMTYGVNYEGTVRLAEAVEPLMDATGRMVFVTSLVDRFGHIEEEPKKEGYAAYARSKTFLSTYVLRRARARSGAMPAFLAVHPGITATALLSPEKTSHKPFFSRLGHAILYIFTHAPEKAALTIVAAAAGDAENGDILAPRGLFGISGYPHKTRFCRRVRRAIEP